MKYNIRLFYNSNFFFFFLKFVQSNSAFDDKNEEIILFLLKGSTLDVQALIVWKKLHIFS